MSCLLPHHYLSHDFNGGSRLYFFCGVLSVPHIWWPLTYLPLPYLQTISHIALYKKFFSVLFNLPLLVSNHCPLLNLSKVTTLISLTISDFMVLFEIPTLHYLLTHSKWPCLPLHQERWRCQAFCSASARLTHNVPTYRSVSLHPTMLSLTFTLLLKMFSLSFQNWSPVTLFCFVWLKQLLLSYWVQVSSPLENIQFILLLTLIAPVHSAVLVPFTLYIKCLLVSLLLQLKYVTSWG